MKTILTGATAVIGIALLLTTALPAQQAKKLIKADTQKQDMYIAGRTAKFAKPVFEKANWLFDYDEARAEAERSGKLLFTYFTRSYAN